jgi:hypothetical protein
MGSNGADHVSDFSEKSVIGLVGQLLLRLPRWIIVILGIYIVIAGAVLVFTAGAFAINLALGGGYLKIGEFTVGINRIVPDSIPKRPEDEIDWQRKSFTASLLMSADPPEVTEAQEYIGDCYPSFRTEGSRSKIIGSSEAAAIVKDKALFKNVKTHLNRLEGLAAAYVHGVADPEMFADAYKDGMATWYMRYQQALPVFKNDCGCTWFAFEQLFTTRPEFKAAVIHESRTPLTERSCPPPKT